MEPQTFDLSVFDNKKSFTLNQFDFNHFWQNKSNRHNQQSFHSTENKKKQSYNHQGGGEQQLPQNYHAPNYEKLKVYPELKKQVNLNNWHNKFEDQQKYRQKEIEQYVQSLKFQNKLRQQKYQKQKQPQKQRNKQQQSSLTDFGNLNFHAVQNNSFFQDKKPSTVEANKNTTNPFDSQINKKNKSQFSLNDFEDPQNPSKGFSNSSLSNIINNYKIQQIKPKLQMQQNKIQGIVKKQIVWQRQSIKSKNTEKQFSLNDFPSVVDKNSDIKSSIISKINLEIESNIINQTNNNIQFEYGYEYGINPNLYNVARFQKKNVIPPIRKDSSKDIQINRKQNNFRNQDHIPNNQFVQFSNFEKNYSSFSSKVINTQPNQIITEQNKSKESKGFNTQKQLSLGDFADASALKSQSSKMNKISQVFQNKINLQQRLKNQKAVENNKLQIQKQKRFSHISSNKQFSLNDFPDPDQFSAAQSSGISKKYNIQKQSSEIFEKGMSISRSMKDISFQQFHVQHNDKFISPKMNMDLEKHNAEYDKLKKYLSDKRNVNMNQFFKQLSEQNRRQQNEPEFMTKYSSRQQFEEYIKQIKLQKKINQQNHLKQREIKQKPGNNNLFKRNQQNQILREQSAKQAFNIKRVIQLQDLTKSSQQKSANVLILDMSNNNFLEPERDISQSKSNKLKKQMKNNKLAINEETQEQKITKLYNTYHKFREDFDRLISQMKQNRQGQQNLMKQIAYLKNSHNQTHEAQIKKLEQKLIMKNLEKIKQKEIQNEKYLEILKTKQIQEQQFHELKKEILQLKKITKNQQNSQNQILQKITNLEQVVKKSITELTESRNKYLNSPLNQRYPNLDQNSIQQFKLIDQSRNKVVSPRTINRQFSSPLQLNLDDESIQKNIKINRNIVFNPVKFMTTKVYPDFAQLYIPKNNLCQFSFKLACIQQNCVIYQSFQFLIHAKYSIVRTEKLKNLKITISIKNKMKIPLNDLFVIIYGSTGEILKLIPSKIFCQNMLPQQIVNIEVYLTQVKLDNQFLSIQMSYRGQKYSIKKISMKVPRPITKFFDIKFTHQVQFKQIYNEIRNELFIDNKLLNFKEIKNSDDIKIILPFIDINQQNETQISYGLLFNIHNIQGLFLLKLICGIDGKASLHIRYEWLQNKKYAETILDVLNSVLYA